MNETEMLYGQILDTDRYIREEEEYIAEGIDDYNEHMGIMFNMKYRMKCLVGILEENITTGKMEMMPWKTKRRNTMITKKEEKVAQDVGRYFEQEKKDKLIGLANDALDNIADELAQIIEIKDLSTEEATELEDKIMDLLT